jgi:hypothetical protein
MLRRLSALSSLLLLSASSSFAQIGGMDLPNIEYNPLLLINAAVQKELHLSPATASKVQSTFMNEAMKLLPTVTGGSSGKPPTEAERRSVMMKGVVHMQSTLAALLTPPQRTRLRQLTLQSIGPAAVLQPKVASALGLSSGQRSSLTYSISAANEKISSGRINASSPANVNNRLQEMSHLQEAAKAEGERALNKTLTPAQKSKWRAMLGKPFALKGFLGIGNGLPMGG